MEQRASSVGAPVAIVDAIAVADGETELGAVAPDGVLHEPRKDLGEPRIELASVDLPSAIDNALTLIKERAGRHGIELSRVVDPAVSGIVADERKFKQILLNLLSNACKFTKEGEVALRARKVADGRDWVELAVADTGIGITKEAQAKIFTPFSQAETSITRKYGGTGLGLSICKSLIEMQGGEIWLESKVGTGSTFRFIVPYKKEEITETTTESFNFMNYQALSKCKILVAEDVEINQFLARHIIESWGAEVHIVDNGQKALDKITNEDYDIILMDIQMPHLNGYETTEIIRKQMPAPINQIPILAQTANVLKSEMDKCFEVGMNDYISKPFDTEILFSKITQLIQTKSETKSKG